jgi:hypothetical protein
MQNIRAVILLAFMISSARAQDPLTTFPKNYSILLDNNAAEVIRVHYAPHEKLGVHDHSINPTVYVYLSDGGPVRFQHFEEKGFTLTRPPTATGAFRISPGRVEKHTVENMGDANSDFLRIELKEIPLGRFKQAFRGPAPRSLQESRTSVEFKNPFVEVQRVVCGNASACFIDPSPWPSVVISFTPLRQLEFGAVRWLPASEGMKFTQDGASPAHLLRIMIPPAQE